MVPIESSCDFLYFLPFPSYGSLLVKLSLATVDDVALTPSLGLILGLGRFDHFHFRFGFGQFWTKNCGLGLPRFGFSTLTATFTSRLQQPDVDVVSLDELPRQWQPAFASLVVQNELARNISITRAGGQPAVRTLLRTPHSGSTSYLSISV